MKTITTQTAKTFLLEVLPGEPETIIEFSMAYPIVRTGCLPKTVTILSEKLPGVLKTTCFNDAGLPFEEEAKDTEIGHLFEHILIQYLYEELDYKFKGVTQWNWNINKRGTFQISIFSENPYTQELQEAVDKAAVLTDEIILSGI